MNASKERSKVFECINNRYEGVVGAYRRILRIMRRITGAAVVGGMRQGGNIENFTFGVFVDEPSVYFHAKLLKMVNEFIYTNLCVLSIGEYYCCVVRIG